MYTDEQKWSLKFRNYFEGIRQDTTYEHLELNYTTVGVHFIT
jgi:hypothetical protein